MSLTDPIADMLTRIRNATRVSKPRVDICGSKTCAGIARVLKEEGFVEDFKFIEDNKQGIVRVYLKYGPEGQPVINTIKRESRPGLRVYKPVSELPKVLNGLGIAVVSTSQGIMSDRQCRKANVGGELLATVH
ncbi:MAG: 30S ribosomal protein S8 [Phycisphaerae bacterium]|nr:30S ribosomal protein S8 [Phycisphaerae bacterium]